MWLHIRLIVGWTHHLVAHVRYILATTWTHKITNIEVTNVIGLDNNCIVVAKWWLKWTRFFLMKEAPWTHIKNTKEFFTCNVSPAFSNLAKGWPMHIDKTGFKPLTKQEKQCQCTNNLCLYCGKQNCVVRECPKKCGPHVTCTIFVTNPQPEK
jgi:hypothetical protein